MKSILQKKVAGFPVWVWLLVLMAAVAIGMYFRAKRAGASDEDMDDEALEDEADPADFYDEDFMGPNQGANELLGLNFQLQRLIEALEKAADAKTPLPRPNRPKKPQHRRPRPRPGLTKAQRRRFRRIRKIPYKQRTKKQRMRFRKLKRKPPTKPPAYDGPGDRVYGPYPYTPA